MVNSRLNIKTIAEAMRTDCKQNFDLRRKCSAEFERVYDCNSQIIENFCSAIPVKIAGLARGLGISVKTSTLGTGISGQIKWDGEQYLIKVNRFEAKNRQRFTIAHEIAHFFLHKQIIQNNYDGITDTVLYRSGEPEYIEFQANRLAADLLMPVSALEYHCELLPKLSGENLTERLASVFEVSEAAMRIRLNKFR